MEKQGEEYPARRYWSRRPYPPPSPSHGASDHPHPPGSSHDSLPSHRTFRFLRSPPSDSQSRYVTTSPRRVPPLPSEESPALYMTSSSVRIPPNFNDVADSNDVSVGVGVGDVSIEEEEGEGGARSSDNAFSQSSSSPSSSFSKSLRETCTSSEMSDRPCPTSERSAEGSSSALGNCAFSFVRSSSTEPEASQSFEGDADLGKEMPGSFFFITDDRGIAGHGSFGAEANNHPDELPKGAKHDEEKEEEEDNEDYYLRRYTGEEEEINSENVHEDGEWNPSASATDATGDAAADDDCDEDDDDDDAAGFRRPTLKGWKSLPAILLEDIFVMLSPKQRHQASMVCQPWYEIFYSPRVWETFVLWERTLTKRRFNLYKGYQRELCPRKTQLCLMRVGCFFKRIIVTAINDYYNLYEFLRVLSSFLSFHPTFPMPLLSTFRFTFACESRGVNGTAIIGTGGNILSMLKDLIINMRELHHLALNELLLEAKEVEGVLAAAARSSEHSLQYLELLNCSKVPVPMCEVTQFTQLVTLKLSPQHLNEEVVLLLGGSLLLKHLHIVQDAYTCSCLPVTHEAWKLFREMSPDKKRVFLEVEGRTTTPLLLQPHAPVNGVVFRTPYHRLTPETVTWLLEYYANSLEYVVQETLPRHHGSRKFSERADESLLRLVRLCPRLHTLVVRERISLATMLLLAREGKALRCLTLRKNALLKKCEWPRAQAWSLEFYRWLKKHGRDYDLAFQQMPQLMKQPWKPALDKAFKHLNVRVM